MKTPWHLWVVGILAVIWNAGGCYDYLMTSTANEQYLSNMSAEHRDALLSMPWFQKALFAISVWGALLASVLLLMRKAFAVPLFVISLLTMLLSFIYTLFIAEIKWDMNAGQMAFTAAIVVVGVLLVIYSRAMRRQGVLS